MGISRGQDCEVSQPAAGGSGGGGGEGGGGEDVHQLWGPGGAASPVPGLWLLSHLRQYESPLQVASELSLQY